jgi:hypothetical protein
MTAHSAYCVNTGLQQPATYSVEMVQRILCARGAVCSLCAVSFVCCVHKLAVSIARVRHCRLFIQYCDMQWISYCTHAQCDEHDTRRARSKSAGCVSTLRVLATASCVIQQPAERHCTAHALASLTCSDAAARRRYRTLQ